MSIVTLRKIILGMAVIIVVGTWLVFKSSREVNLVNEIQGLREGLSEEESPLNNYYDLIDVADSLVISGNPALAFEYLSEHIHEFPDFTSPIYFKMGELYFNLGDYENAISEFNSAIVTSRFNHPRAYKWKAYAFVNLRILDSARVAADKMLSGNSSWTKEFDRINHFADSIERIQKSK